MDMGIKGKNALVCASSKGLGKACAMALAMEGARVTMTARTVETLKAAADEVAAATGAEVQWVAGDITTVEGREAALKTAGPVDILVNNAGGPPPGDFRDWTRDDWIKALDGNMLTAIELIKATIDGMIDRRFGRIVNITSVAVKNPIPQLGLSNGARAGLTGFVAGLSRQVAPHNVTINNLLPGYFLTDRLINLFKSMAADQGIDYDEVVRNQAAGVPTNSLGDPEDFGKACAFLCSAHASYIVGQNITLDGGLFNGTL